MTRVVSGKKSAGKAPHARTIAQPPLSVSIAPQRRTNGASSACRQRIHREVRLELHNKLRRMRAARLPAVGVKVHVRAERLPREGGEAVLVVDRRHEQAHERGDDAQDDQDEDAERDAHGEAHAAGTHGRQQQQRA
eukprot:2969644-Pleurochrysis_carterae.AAC.15